MSDIFDALMENGTPDPASLAASLRTKANLGVLGSMTGMPDLQKLGPTLTAQADKGAQDYAALRDRTQAQALARAIALQNHLDAMTNAEANRDAANSRSTDSLALRQQLADEARQAKLDAAEVKTDEAAKKQADSGRSIVNQMDDMVEKAQKIKDNPDLWKVTGLMAKTPSWGLGSGSDIDAWLHSLAGEQMISTVQSMRTVGNSSLGRVTNLEAKGMQEAVAPILAAQTLQGKKDALAHFIKYTQAARARIASAAGLESESGAGSEQAGATALPQTVGAGGGGLATPNNPFDQNVPQDAPNPADNEPAIEPGAAQAPARTVVRTGRRGNQKVVQYSDGSIEAAP